MYINHCIPFASTPLSSPTTFSFANTTSESCCLIDNLESHPSDTPNLTLHPWKSTFRTKKYQTITTIEKEKSSEPNTSIFRWVEPPVFFQGVYFRCHQLRFLFGVPRPITPQQFHCYSAQGGWPSGELLEFDANSFSESVAWMLWKIAFHFFFLLRNIVSYKSYMLSPEFCFCMFLVKKPSQRMIHKLQVQRMLCPKSWVKGSMPTRFPIETPFNVHMAAIFRAFDAKWDLASVSPVSYEMFHTQ